MSSFLTLSTLHDCSSYISRWLFVSVPVISLNFLLLPMSRKEQNEFFCFSFIYDYHSKEYRIRQCVWCAHIIYMKIQYISENKFKSIYVRRSIVFHVSVWTWILVYRILVYKNIQLRKSQNKVYDWQLMSGSSMEEEEEEVTWKITKQQKVQLISVNKREYFVMV